MRFTHVVALSFVGVLTGCPTPEGTAPTQGDFDALAVRNALLEAQVGGMLAGLDLPSTASAADVEQAVRDLRQSVDLTGYATEAYVSTYAAEQGFVTSDGLDAMGLATQTWVTGQGYLGPSALDGYATQAYVGGLGFASSSDLGDYVLQTTHDEDYMAVDDRLLAMEPLFQYLTVDPLTGDIYVTGANLHIRSGAGSTDASVNGWGNLIIGYNAANDFTTSDQPDALATRAEPYEVGPHPMTVSDLDRREGSHNLIIGDHHQFMGHSSIVSGQDHRSLANYTAIMGGSVNTVTGAGSGALGSQVTQVRGPHNAAVGADDALVGGLAETGRSIVVLGSTGGRASGAYTVLVGGDRGDASGACILLGSNGASGNCGVASAFLPHLDQ